MPTIVFKLTRAPSDTAVEANVSICWTAAVRNWAHRLSLRNCGFVIASGIEPRQRVAVDKATCSACGAENEFPPELRS